MQKMQPSPGIRPDGSTPTKIGLISALIVALCGLLGTTLTVAGAILNTYLSSQAAQASVLLTIQATQTAEARVIATGGPASPGPPTPSPGPTEVPPTPTPSPGPAVFVVINKLVLPIRISINGAYRGEVGARSLVQFPLDSEPVHVTWEIIKETTAEGQPLGDDMGTTVSGIRRGAVLTVNNVVGGQAYFYPFISNRTDCDCAVTINRGWRDENVTHAIISAGQDNVGLGYFRLFENSNVTLDCGDERYWWGLASDESAGKSFYDDVEPDTGVIRFTLEPS